MRRVLFAYLVIAFVACQPLYPESIAPRDAKFAVSCTAECGGGNGGIAIDVSFAKGGFNRQISFCCADRAEILARLKTVADFWCDGLAVPAKEVGGIIIGTNVSETTGERGASLDGGDGYVSFNCDAWLPELLAQLDASPCCQ
jgi:hypothetical protein